MYISFILSSLQFTVVTSSASTSLLNPKAATASVIWAVAFERVVCLCVVPALFLPSKMRCFFSAGPNVEVTKCVLPPKKLCQGLSRERVSYTIKVRSFQHCYICKILTGILHNQTKVLSDP